MKRTLVNKLVRNSLLVGSLALGTIISEGCIEYNKSLSSVSQKQEDSNTSNMGSKEDKPKYSYDSFIDAIGKERLMPDSESKLKDFFVKSDRSRNVFNSGKFQDLYLAYVDLDKLYEKYPEEIGKMKKFDPKTSLNDEIFKDLSENLIFFNPYLEGKNFEESDKAALYLITKGILPVRDGPFIPRPLF